MASEKFYNQYPFSGIPTFIRSPYVDLESNFRDKEYSIGILGIPFDEGATYSPGSRFAPRSIRAQSLRMPSKGIYSYDEKKEYLVEEYKRKSIVDFGDVTIIPCDIEGNFDRITSSVRKIIENDALLISIGGDHSITYPTVRAFDRRPIHVLQFDAHPDYLPIEPNFENTNGHPMTQISKMKHVKSLTQVGIRSIRSFDGIGSIEDGNRVVSMKEFKEIGPKGVAEILPKGEPVFVSIDIDAYDISLVPGCGSAEPNGFMYNELRDTLAEVARHSEVVGFDLVEVAPDMDIRTNLTSYIGLLTIMEFLGHICDQPYWKKRYENKK